MIEFDDQYYSLLSESYMIDDRDFSRALGQYIKLAYDAASSEEINSLFEYCGRKLKVDRTLYDHFIYYGQHYGRKIACDWVFDNIHQNMVLESRRDWHEYYSPEGCTYTRLADLFLPEFGKKRKQDLEQYSMVKDLVDAYSKKRRS